MEFEFPFNTVVRKNDRGYYAKVSGFGSGRALIMFPDRQNRDPIYEGICKVTNVHQHETYGFFFGSMVEFDAGEEDLDQVIDYLLDNKLASSNLNVYLMESTDPKHTVKAWFLAQTIRVPRNSIRRGPGENIPVEYRSVKILVRSNTGKLKECYELENLDNDILNTYEKKFIGRADVLVATHYSKYSLDELREKILASRSAFFVEIYSRGESCKFHSSEMDDLVSMNVAQAYTYHNQEMIDISADTDAIIEMVTHFNDDEVDALLEIATKCNRSADEFITASIKKHRVEISHNLPDGTVAIR